MTLPRVQPIAPTWRKEPFDDPDWIFDFKYDGFRALYYIEPGHNRLISHNLNLLTRFDALGGALAAELNVDDAIIDGEVIAADETGRPQFYDLLRSTRAPAYVAFDIVWLNGADLRSLPLHERRRVLQTVLPKGSPICWPTWRRKSLRRKRWSTRLPVASATAFRTLPKAAQAKIFTSEMAIKVTNDALQLFGAAGYSRNRPLERMVRDARMFTIGGGKAQILRTVVASRLLGRKLPQSCDGYVAKTGSE